MELKLYSVDESKEANPMDKLLTFTMKTGDGWKEEAFLQMENYQWSKCQSTQEHEKVSFLPLQKEITKTISLNTFKITHNEWIQKSYSTKKNWWIYHCC